MYSNDSKVTPSVSSMDVSRLGSNIIKVKIINIFINMQINGNLWSLKAIFGRDQRSYQTLLIKPFARVIRKVVNSSHECEIMII